ncbi:DUF6878 family protein [Litoreibacter roseus]|uniref:DUF6878 domain-containing protein n=1 Tax=Litoreibacter roseus TaxID=2601869 RepID=A0A6N6JNF9_9RHOB|nr:DUF6878 family protein [Litoreibacter roseus]GFE67099.1 hypothetical protein KIN_41730 [Litoreibacter roseus]
MPTKPTNAEIISAMEEAQRQRETALKDERARLLVALRAAGATGVTVQYDAYGDSGNVQDMTLEPVGTELSSEDAKALENFGWDQAYSLHPGFENNEGGYGEMTWDITEDRIDLTHHDRFVDHDTTTHEGV